MAESTSKATSLDAEGGEAQASSTSDVADKLKGLVVRTFWRIEQFLAGIMGLEDSKYQSYVDEAEIEHRKRLQEEQDMDGTMAGGQLKDGAAEDKVEIEVV